MPIFAGMRRYAGPALRSFFCIMAYMSIVCASLTFPSLARVAAFALGNIYLAACLMQREVVSSELRAFWLRYFAGVTADSGWRSLGKRLRSKTDCGSSSRGAGR